MKKAVLILISVLILMVVPIGLALESNQQFNKILLDPFYRQSMNPDTDYTYDMTFSPPAGITSVQSAIVTFQMWLNPTVEFFLTVDGQSCNTPSYEVHTTYAGAGEGTIFFDCSNIINSEGTYTIILTPDDDTGAVTGWVDITYSDNQSDYIGTVGTVDTVGTVTDVQEAQMDMHGTEYFSDEPVKVWLQLLNGTNQPIEQAVCYLWVYAPTNFLFITRANMYYIDDGIYAYDFDAPFIGGVYPAISQCFYTAVQDYNFATAFTPHVYASETGTYTNTHALDLVDHTIKEAAANPKRVAVEYAFEDVCTDSDEDLLTGFSVGMNVKWQSSTDDHLYIWWWNWTDSTWNEFPNVVNYDTDRLIVSNSKQTNNLSRDGYTDVNGNFKIYINDTANTDSGSSFIYMDYLYVTCDELSNPQWSELKGSSEVHVSLDEATIFGFLLEENSITFGLNAWYEGDVFINYTIFSRVLEPTTIKHTYPLPFDMDCEDINYFSYQLDNGTQVYFYDYNSGDFHCEIDIDTSSVSLVWDREVDVSGVYLYQLSLKNTLKRTVDKLESNVNSFYGDFDMMCQEYFQAQGFGAKPSIPLTTKPAYLDSFADGCSHFWNAYYYFNESVEEVEELYALVVDAETFNLYEEHTHRVIVYHNTLIDDLIVGAGLVGVFSEYSESSANKSPAYQFWSQYATSHINYDFAYNNLTDFIWSRNERTLTDYHEYEISEFVWNFTERTLTGESQLWVGGTEYSPDEEEGKVIVRLVDNTDTPVDDAECILRVAYPNNTLAFNITMEHFNGSTMGGVYIADFTLPTDPGVYPYGVDCLVTGGASPKNYYLLDTFHVFGANITKTAQAIWNYTTRTLTEDLIVTVNETAIAQAVWFWEGIISSNIINRLSQPVTDILITVNETAIQPRLTLP